jgi:Phage regulatory protein Rha (Phage_pRha)
MPDLTAFEHEDGELVVDSRLIADRLQIEHESFLKTLDTYENQIQQAFGILRFEIGKIEGRGRPPRYALLSEDQATFVMTLSRNSPEVVQCKIELVQAFSKAKKMLGHRRLTDFIHQDLDREWQLWQQWYDIRIELKDHLRPELMNAVVRWAQANGASPRTICSKVHEAMNKRIMGAESQQIRLMGGLLLSELIRDYFGASPLNCYSAINRIAKNLIVDKQVEPIQAVHEACDHFLGKAFVPKFCLMRVSTREGAG